MSERWIVIPKWDGQDGFQHYKDREPKWIKVYRSLLTQDEFLNLSHHLRGVLLGLWLEYAASNRQLRDNNVTLTRRLGQRVTKRDIERLYDAGFLEFSLAKPYQNASLDKIREEKKVSRTDTRRNQPSAKAAVFAMRTLIANGYIQDHDHLIDEAHAAGLNDLEAQQLAKELNGRTAA